MPRKEDLKNWKIKECFISDRDGWCNHCKTRTWKKGHKIYWMEKPNHAGWAACTDKKCYEEQGGRITIYTPPVATTEAVFQEEKEPPEIQLNMKSDHDLILMLMGKVSILEHVIEGLVKK